MLDLKSWTALPSRLPTLPTTIEPNLPFLPAKIDVNARTVLASLVAIYGSSILIRALFPNRKHDTLPRAKGALPIIGHAAAFESEPAAWLKEQFLKLGEAVSVNFAGWEVAILGPKYVREYFAAPDAKLDFNAAVVESLAADVTVGMGVITNPFHITALRERFNPLLIEKHQIVFDAMEGFVQSTIGKQMAGKVSGQPVILDDVRDWSWRIVAKSSARCFVGEKLSDNQQLIDIFISYNGVINTAMRHYRLMPNFLKPITKYFIGRPIRQQETQLGAIIFPEILERQKLRHELGDSWQAPDDMLQFLIDSRRPDGLPEPNDEILSRVFALIFASMITTTFRTWQFVYDIAGNAEVQKQLYEEQLQVIAKHGTAFTKDAVSDMKLMDNCVRESLRLSVSVFASSRKAMQDVEFADGTQLPKGRMVMLAGYDIQRDPERYANPDEFNPSHHAGKVSTTPDRNFILFGMGKHACPGRFFAALEMKAALAALLRSYEFHVVEDAISLKRCKRPAHMTKPDEMYMEGSKPIAIYKRA
ncbi:hypothetical protein HK097_009291 [Rhizophlyctis rosea]|uniref:Cytochrome P450 n=1 Tax=Rhizophlyctis rosea TaxID=64517 RepID=A0AAD5X3D0_9FUNG|nr:hypothetical protein HK097_009291 [Rhizophlyctis rosea]